MEPCRSCQHDAHVWSLKYHVSTSDQDFARGRDGAENEVASHKLVREDSYVIHLGHKTHLSAA